MADASIVCSNKSTEGAQHRLHFLIQTNTPTEAGILFDGVDFVLLTAANELILNAGSKGSRPRRSQPARRRTGSATESDGRIQGRRSDRPRRR